MATINPRINVTLSDVQLGVLAMMAKREKKSVSAIARDLIEEALELQEDIYYSRISDERLKNSKKTYTEEEVWKMFGE